MVHLVLFSPKANTSSKYFPYHGYLGLTPLRVEGIVRTKLDEDNKLLPAKSLFVTVRCYEYRLGRLSVLASHVLVDQSQELWRKRDDLEYEEIGDGEWPFRITLPAGIGGFSTVHFTDYRVFWKVEAVLTHIPISGIGTRQLKAFELPLIRYDVPSPLIPALELPPLLTPTISAPTSSPSTSLSHPLLDCHQFVPSKLKTGPIRYAIHVPHTAIGPEDLVSVGVWLGVEGGVSVKSVEVVIERRIEIRDGESSNTSPSKSVGSPDGLGPRPPTPSTASASSSTTSLTPTAPSTITTNTAYPRSFTSSASAATVDTFQSTSPLLRSPSYAPSTSGTSSSGSSGSASTLTLTTANLRPAPSPTLSQSHSTSPSSPSSPRRGSSPNRPFLSSVKETNGGKAHVHQSQITSATSTHLSQFHEPGLNVFSKTMTLQWPSPKSSSRWALGGDVRFFVKVRAMLQSASGTDTIELQSQPEVLIVSTNEAQRHLALSKYTEAQTKPKSKSKSPRRHYREEREREAEVISGVPIPIPPSKLGKERATGMGRSGSASATVSGSGARSYSSSSGEELVKEKERWNTGSVSSTSSSIHHPTPPVPVAVPLPKSASSSSGKRKTSRRPHTSAGPRDRGSSVSAGAVGIGGAFYTPGLPDREAFHTRSVDRAQVMNGSVLVDRERERKEREWEEELARIENRSRRSSADMLGFGRNAKRLILNAVGVGRV
ncbi:hypothetical protein NEOLEDRAFT_1154464 [Neolentinus lepideus HHB14362 ss-1]|uniref:Uncharacterized protein n=1 Tax=Neolentinus lepideus HHB14362 ss-1 TaxID=1314782 RepID=A0A165UQB8_9AGAM|nr:hypothetical protein NEOLEDRAFT_1154464 [Neolentinus lepideus HHB14362 ss-1]